MTAPPALRRPPRIGPAFVAAGVALSAFALATGVLDILLPVLRGEPSFGFLYAATEVLGPAYLFWHVFLHNLGIAVLVPAVGLLAAAYERDPRQRRLIGPILLASVVGTLVVATELVVRRGYWTSPVVAALLLVEASAVLLLAWKGHRALAGYVPTPRAAWSWAKPVRDVLPYAAISASALALGAFVETLYVVRSIGL